MGTFVMTSRPPHPAIATFSHGGEKATEPMILSQAFSPPREKVPEGRMRGARSHG